MTLTEMRMAGVGIGEEARAMPDFQRFMLLGGDAAVGHFYYAHPAPVTEAQRHTAYPGCYALSKVL